MNDIRLIPGPNDTWSIAHDGIERGPFSQVEAIREVAAIMSYPRREEAPKLGPKPAWLYDQAAGLSPYAKAGGAPARRAPRDMYDDGVSSVQDRTYRETVATLPVVDGRPYVEVTGTEHVTSDGRPVDTFGRTPEEAAFIAGVQAYRRGIRYAATSADWYGRGYIWAAGQTVSQQRRRQFDDYLKNGPIA